ncbi:Vi polysaccharide biosynthesis protein VipA/TviB [Synechococcus sp. GFB01]|nr:Vi polysaccharide biosynthesis protein VipA/TviB [Synechococcus sp. GFB01]
MFPDLNNCTVAVIGLGYVGLPLAVAFATPQACLRSGQPLRRRVIGFEINAQRLEELRQGRDRTNETSAAELEGATLLEFTTDPAVLAAADVFVVTVPTPIDSAKRPDLVPLQQASAMVGGALRARAERGAPTQPLVILESTVYPGATEEVCVPLLERESGLVFNRDFVCGYSPERINPGDREHRLTTLVKVTSGSTPEAAAWVDGFYGSIVAAGTHPAASLRVAEAAKVIENTQRDLNIALVNELAVICRRLGIDTLDVLEAAGTKWNFLPFRPGLVGGHCIGVDPFYLTHKAQQLGYQPEVMLAGRRINDGMGAWLVEELIQELTSRHLPILDTPVLLLGLAFKENCPDIRNTGVAAVVATLRRFGMVPVVVDPWVDPAEAERELGLAVAAEPPADARFTALIAAVGHRQFRAWNADRWRCLLEPGGVLLDVKGIVPRELKPLRL